MSLNDALKTATIEDLKKVSILMLDSYARQNNETLTFLYEHEIIDDSSIEGALEEAVFRQERQERNNKEITRIPKEGPTQFGQIM